MNVVGFRIEETWRLWCKFLEEYSRFEDWLKIAELTAANPDSANILYTSAKEELKKFEVSRRFSLVNQSVQQRLNKVDITREITFIFTG